MDGGWSEWSDWSECNVSCGVGSSARHRDCSRPSPVNDGAICQGQPQEYKQCTRLCQRKSFFNGYPNGEGGGGRCSLNQNQLSYLELI